MAPSADLDYRRCSRPLPLPQEVSLSHLLSAARDLRSTIDANAQKAGANPIPRATVDALLDAGIYGLMTPKDRPASTKTLQRRPSRDRQTQAP